MISRSSLVSTTTKSTALIQSPRPSTKSTVTSIKSTTSSTKSTIASIKSTTSSTKSTIASINIRSTTSSTKSAIASIRSTTSSTKSSTISTRPSTTSAKSGSQITKPTTTKLGLLSAISTTVSTASKNSSASIQESGLFCHPHCTGTFVGIAFGSLLGVVIVMLVLIVASRIYNRRRQSKSDAHLSSNQNTTIARSTTDITGEIVISQTDAHDDASTTTNNRNTVTLTPQQRTSRSRPLVSNSNNEEPNRTSEHIYVVMKSIVKQNPNPTQRNPTGIYLDPISDESGALPRPPPSQPPAENEHVYYNVGRNGSSLLGVDDIEYEIVDCRMPPASTPAVIPQMNSVPHRGYRR